jgi:hypothetical protein
MGSSLAIKGINPSEVVPVMPCSCGEIIEYRPAVANGALIVAGIAIVQADKHSVCQQAFRQLTPFLHLIILVPESVLADARMLVAT